jgi:hypothetical protein
MSPTIGCACELASLEIIEPVERIKIRQVGESCAALKYHRMTYHNNTTLRSAHSPLGLFSITVAWHTSFDRSLLRTETHI